MAVQNGKFFGQPLDECLEEIEKIAQDAMTSELSDSEETKDVYPVDGQEVKVIVGRPVAGPRLAETQVEQEFFGEA